MKTIKPDTYTQNKKLICDWSDKKIYLIHYRMLEFYIRHGMKVERFHNIISFKQSNWLEKYISFNTQKRNKAKNELEKDFYKLLSNAFYGKTMENVRNRIKVDFIRKDDTNEIIKQQSKLTFNGIHHTPIQTRILKELNELKDKEKLNPQETTESRTKFLKRFDWTDTLLTEMEKQAIEDILVEYHDIFARHRMDIGMNTEFKVKLTPKNDKAVYSQSLPMPIHLKEDLIVELALMHKYGIITVLPFSKYASPIFAQRKPNGKLRLLVDLRKINSLIADDYTNNNHPVSTLSDAAQHLAGKSLFCKLDCSQAYHCLQMAEQRSVEMLAFNFASRTFAYKRLAQGLSRSVSAFSSFMREYLDPVVKADQCAQYVDDIGIAANNATDLTRNIRAVFKCIRQAGFKLTIEKCHFGLRQFEFLGRTISPEGISPQARKIQNFLDKLRFPKS